MLLYKEEQKQPGLTRVRGPVLPTRQPQLTTHVSTMSQHLHQLGLQQEAQGGGPERGGPGGNSVKFVCVTIFPLGTEYF